MAYNQKVAVCIIGQDGKVYNEDGKGVCKIPFGEYKVRVINKNDKRIGFDVLINGEKVTKAGKVILSAHDKIDLERWLDFESCGDKLKFIPKDSKEAKAAGKTGEFEGSLEVRVHLERELPKIEKIVEEHHHHHHHDHYDSYPYPWWKHNYYPIWYTCTSEPLYGGGSTTSPKFDCNSAGEMKFGATVNEVKCTSLGSGSQPLTGMAFCNYSSAPVEGATVRGSHSKQSFSSTYVNLEEDYFSIKMYMMGFETEKQMEFDFVADKDNESVTLTAFCPDCGTKGTDEDKFCRGCGKRLKK